MMHKMELHTLFGPICTSQVGGNILTKRALMRLWQRQLYGETEQNEPD